MVGISEDRGFISGYQTLLKKLLQDLQPSSLLQQTIFRDPGASSGRKVRFPPGDR